MRMRGNFKIPEEFDESDELDELVDAENVEDIGIAFDPVGNDTDGSNSEVGGDINREVLIVDDTDDSFDPYATDSDDIGDDDDDDDDDDLMEDAVGEKIVGGAASDNNAEGPSGSGGGDSAVHLLNVDDEEDDTVRAIISAIKKPRSSPPEIKIDDFITDICFHPTRDIIALGTISGDVCLYEYANEENKLLRTIEIHAKACRDVEFSDDGINLLTCSKDKSIMVTDMETEKLKKFYESAHDDAINKLYVVDENLFTTGDDSGTVKFWDLRAKYEIFSIKVVEDYITQMLTNDDKKLLLVSSGDGYLSTINITARKLYVQSEPYEEELTCMGIYRGDSKVVVGTSKGNLYTYNWGQFGYHCDKYPGIKTSINLMIPITDRIGCVAGEEGIIHACHIAPFRNLGVVGQHNMPIESLDISNSGELIASASHNSDVRFWNVKYFEDFGDIKYNEKHNAYKEKLHNLPSSKFSNASDFFADLAKPATDDES